MNKNNIKIYLKDKETKVIINDVEVPGLTNLEIKRDAEVKGTTSLIFEICVLNSELTIND